MAGRKLVGKKQFKLIRKVELSQVKMGLNCEWA